MSEGLPAVAITPLSRPVSASVRVPGSKSYTNRALICAALADGKSTLDGALFSDDTEYMAKALSSLGLDVKADPTAYRLDVTGSGGKLPERDAELFVGNAGTAARFLAVFLSLGRGRYLLDGIERMRERPMGPLLDALRKLGATVEERGLQGCLPVCISANPRGYSGATLTLPGTASSQFFSGLLLSAPYLGGVTLDVEGRLVSRPYLDMTAQVMRSFGVEMQNREYQSFAVSTGQRYTAANYVVEPDASAASYFFAAAALTGGEVTVEGLGTESLQGDLGFVDILEKMGARVLKEARRTTVIGPAQLHGVEVDMRDLSDTAQTLAVLAPFADSPTRIKGIGFIRKKETDRVGAVVHELRRLGVAAEEEADGMLIRPSVPGGGRVHTYDDHRMAMSFALIGLRRPGIEISNPACTSKTFPNYFEVLETLRV